MLQQEKAAQRLLKTDEEREARLVKLDMIKKQQAEKARVLKEQEAAQKSTHAQLELLYKQKEQQAIRRLIQEKGEADRGMGREKNAARAKRDRQERSAAERREIEADIAKQLARKRETNVVKDEQRFVKRNQEIASAVREIKEQNREKEYKRAEEKDEIITENWARKADGLRDREKKKEEFYAMEEVRDRMNLDRDRRRAHAERDRFRALRAWEEKIKDETLTRQLGTRKEYLLKWVLDSKYAAMEAREQRRRTAMRDVKIKDMQEMRLRKFRETQFMETVNARGRMSPEQLAADDAKNGGEDPLQSGTKEEIEAFQKSYEQQERAVRQAAREELRKSEDAKQSKLTALIGPDPNVREQQRIAKWRGRDAAVTKKLEDAKLNRELEGERRGKASTEKTIHRAELWIQLDAKRKRNEEIRENRRNEKCTAHAKQLAPGLALPSVLVF